jgi:glycerate kinase
LHPGREGLPAVRIACDVKNPLLGPNGAAAVYGPQKGLPEGKLPYFEAEGERLARMLLRFFEKTDDLLTMPGAGAAGGIGFGLVTAADAKLVSGFELVADWLQLEERVRQSDLILTGEGRFDDSSLQGKGPFAILEMAAAAGDKSVFLLAGSLEVSDIEQLESQYRGFQARAIAHPDWDLARNLEEGPERLKVTLEALLEENSGS